MALSAGLFGFDAHKIIWVPALILTAFGKIMWERQHKTSTPTAV
jgi:hypothetical protein